MVADGVKIVQLKLTDALRKATILRWLGRVAQGEMIRIFQLSGEEQVLSHNPRRLSDRFALLFTFDPRTI